MKTAIFGVWHVHAVDYAQKALQHGEVIGFFERDDSLAVEFSKRLGIPRFSTEKELLESEAQGVIVCSATCDHASDIIKVAKAKKNIFTEKVLALTDEECKEIEKAVNENGVEFTISLFQKSLGARICVKKLVESGELGKINYARVRNCHSGSSMNWLPPHFYNKKQCGGGAMIDLGAHGMYLLNWILGTPKKALSAFSVCCSNPETALKNIDCVEDNAVTVMQFENGAIGVNETGFVSSAEPIVFEVHGENGYVLAQNDVIVKCTSATEGKPVAVEPEQSLPLPIEQFLKGERLAGYGMDEAKALTHMMVLAYGK